MTNFQVKQVNEEIFDISYIADLHTYIMFVDRHFCEKMEGFLILITGYKAFFTKNENRWIFSDIDHIVTDVVPTYYFYN